MARRIIPSGVQRWQPQTPLDVAPEYQAGLAFALLPGVGWGVPMASLVEPTALASTSFTDLRYGQAYKATAQAKAWNTACGSLGNEYTLLVLASYTASVYLIADDSPTANLVTQCGGAAGKFLVTAYNTGGTAYSATSQAVSTNEQLTGAVVGFRVSSSQSKVQTTVDGITTTTATTGTLRSPSNPRVGAGKGVINANGVIAFAAAWSRYMPDGELLALLANPYGVFRPRARRVFFGTVASGSVGSAVGHSTSTGVEGYVARATGASTAQAIEGYVGNAQGRSTATAIPFTGSVGSAVGRSTAQGVEGYVGGALGRSVAAALSPTSGSVGTATGKSVAQALCGSVATAVGQSIVDAPRAKGSAVARSLAEAVSLGQAVIPSLGLGPIVVPRTVLTQGDITPAMREWMVLVTQALSTQVSTLLSPVAAKGDLWGFSDMNARVPVGPPGTKLTADPTSPTGVSWQ